MRDIHIWGKLVTTWKDGIKLFKMLTLNKHDKILLFLVYYS